MLRRVITPITSFPIGSGAELWLKEIILKGIRSIGLRETLIGKTFEWFRILFNKRDILYNGLICF